MIDVDYCYVWVCGVLLQPRVLLSVFYRENEKCANGFSFKRKKRASYLRHKNENKQPLRFKLIRKVKK
jgi:hypothetical protein